MSYILNALKNSENQRNRGEIPHIDSQPEFVRAVPGRWPEALWKWLVFGILLAAGLGWVWLHPAAQAPVISAQAPLVQPVVSVAALVPSAPQDAPQAPGLPALAGMSGVHVRLGEEAEALLQEPLRTPALRESPRVVLDMPVSAGVAPARPVAPPVAPAAPVREEAPVEVLSGVSHWKTAPAAVQQQLRGLAFTAHVYSSKPQARFVRVSGRTLHEGDPLAEGLKLVQITRDGVVFAQGGQSYWYGVN